MKNSGKILITRLKTGQIWKFWVCRNNIKIGDGRDEEFWENINHKT
jgi:hypothetical protein